MLKNVQNTGIAAIESGRFCDGLGVSIVGAGIATFFNTVEVPKLDAPSEN